MFSLFLLTGCIGEKKEVKKNKIVTSNWIGYAPILYAYEIGDLEKLNIELIVSSSLQSSVLMYKKNKLDGICSTKIEIDYINQSENKSLHITPISIFNRSYGGDVIFIESTKNDKILVFDFLSVNNNSFTKTQIKKLQNIINKSINTLQNNPKKVFESIKFYYDDITYEEFNTLLTEIKLFSKERKDIFLSLIKKEKICNKQNYLKEQ